MQTFKAIYFPDYKTINSNAKGFVLAFGRKNKDLYQTVAPLTSHEVRELLGTSSFIELEKNAGKEGLPVSTYCVWRLRKAVEQSTQNLSIFVNKSRREIKPIYVTFKGGKQNPLHSWYSYLEGYSPEFVEYILDNYTQNARAVYDPFAGTGVTPLVAAKRGLPAFYSEVNPLLQFLVRTKVSAAALSEKNRSKILVNLEKFKTEIDLLINESPIDNNLREAYEATFADSKFFDNHTFGLVLKARSLIDEISYTSQLTADIILVAVINSLIPASFLQRAGDLRYKTEKELGRKTDFVETVKQNLENIISDIRQIEPLPITPTLITENAKLIDKIPQLKISAVITSPPYLNGTNYFRNTKVELWFLRSIKNRDDLSGFRRATVTAGINDVTQKKQLEFTTPKIRAIVDALKEKSYDQRIPKMVSDYFQDIARIFSGLRSQLEPNADIAIDIGDSIYSGIKVPTDELFINVLETLGYQFKESINLRKRVSRNGEVLRQVLLIFKWPVVKKNPVKTARADWQKEWQSFKDTLPHKNEPYAKRNWGHPLHSLCSYQGKMKPSLAYFLIKAFTKPGDTILDPFAGVGTIPFEAALNGVRSYAFDISPAALSIAKAKLGKADRQESITLIKKLENYIRSKKLSDRILELAKQFGFNKKLADYFEAKTLREIVIAREFFKENPPTTASEHLVFSCLLHILHGNRPYALSRRSHGITPFAPTGEFEYKNVVNHLKDKVERSFTVTAPSNFVEGDMVFQDATSWWPREIDNLDAIITSPPFFDSTRFYLANWLRLWLSGWNQEDFEKRPLGFVDEKQKLGFEIYEPILRQARERLKPGGVVVFHLGKSSKCDMAEKLAEVAKKWFKVADIFEESVEDGESHGIRDKGTVVKHQFLVLQ